jgi:hypothetical protein
MGRGRHFAKTVVDLLCVCMGDKKPAAESAEDLVSVYMEREKLNAGTVKDLDYAFTKS